MVRRPPWNGWWHRSRGCGATIHSERTPKITRSVPVSKSHRQETRTIYRLTNRRLSPKAQEKIETSQGKQVHRGRRKGCGKDARFARLEIPTGFPQPQQQQTFSGYISNGATWITRVTFSNGVTRAPHQFKALIFRFAKMACPDALTRFSP
jgi:hypothetical protein